MSSIRTDSDGTHMFILGRDERCPFLNDNNLCDIILTLGEDYLCDICHEHPRFYIEADGEYVKGYGLCCEEAARLILFGRSDEGISLQDDFDVTDSNQNEVLLFLNDSWLCDEKEIFRWIEFLCTLEQLGDEWVEWLRKIKEKIFFVTGKVMKIRENNDIFYMDKIYPFVSLYKYLLFRHQDYEFSKRIVQTIFLMVLTVGNEYINAFETGFVEICRVYSSEIEYSDENVDKIKEYIRDDGNNLS